MAPDANAVAGRLAYRVGQLEYEKAELQDDNEQLRSALAGLENRVKQLEESHAVDLPERGVQAAEQYPDGAEHRRPSPADLAHHGGKPSGNGSDVPPRRVSGN